MNRTNTILYTRNGLYFGNSFIVEDLGDRCHIVTDYGHCIVLDNSEIVKYFFSREEVLEHQLFEPTDDELEKDEFLDMMRETHRTYLENQKTDPWWKGRFDGR